MRIDGTLIGNINSTAKVVIGANGVGKTSLLDALSLLSSSADGKLNKTLNDLGGVAELSTRGGAKKISLAECPEFCLCEMGCS